MYVGLSAVCGKHVDPENPHLECRRNLDFGGDVTEQECEKRLFRWLVKGLSLGPEERKAHMGSQLQPRKMTEPPSAEELALARAEGISERDLARLA